jgi:hypothetical protein
MSVAKTKKYVFFGRCCTLLSLLLLTLSGCNATSELRPTFEATGSWQGTIGADQVRGIISPDHTYHLTIVNAAGEFDGEYVGLIGAVNAENVGSMTLIRLHAGDAVGLPQPANFKLSADRLFSLQGIELTRTGEADGPAVPSAVAGHWSLAAADNITDVVVNADGTLSGNDGVDCSYSGSLQLLSPSWNIYFLDVTLATLPGGSCNHSAYSGLAMILPPENDRRRLWFAANNRVGGGIKTFFGVWSETANAAPETQMTILGERADQSVLVQKDAAVELDAQGTSDANHDALSYTWSVTYPNGNSSIMTGSTVKFVPDISVDNNGNGGSYSLELKVSDGIDSTTLTRQLQVVWTLDRFIACGNGTALDTRTNLLWLQDAGCVALNQGVVNWGVSHAEALARVGTLSNGVCQLGDSSAAGDWHLPTLKDFSYIVPLGQWRAGNFVHVGTNPDPAGRNLPFYWTAERDPVVAANWLFADVSYVAPADWFGSLFENNPIVAVWPVRALRAGEQCPPVP